MTDAEFLSTGYLGLQTGILGITALFTLVFAYVGGLHLFLRKESVTTRAAVYTLFVFAFLFLMMFLYSASLYGEEWIALRRASNIGAELKGYSSQSVNLMRIFGALIGIATLSFVTVETFRARK